LRPSSTGPCILYAERALDEGSGDRAAAQQCRGKPNPLLVGEPGHLDRERQSPPSFAQIGNAGNRGDQSERAVPFAGIADGVVMRTKHQARQAGTVALVTAADVADRIEMRMHAGLNHPVQDEVGRRAMLPSQEDARKVLRRLGNRGQPVDPADDLIAERVLVSGARRVHFTHAIPMAKTAPMAQRCSTDRYKFGAGGQPNSKIVQ
jgi:hypothetical protein